MRDRGGGQPIAVIAHIHGHPRAALAVWLEASCHGHREGAVTQGIADEVSKDNVEAAAVQPHGQSGRHVSGYVRPAPPAKAPVHGGRDVGVIGHQLCGTCVETGDLDEVLDQPVKVQHLLLDQPRGGCGVPGQSRVLVEDADHRRHRRQRSPQLMGHIAGELPGACLHLL